MSNRWLDTEKESTDSVSIRVEADEANIRYVLMCSAGFVSANVGSC